MDMCENEPQIHHKQIDSSKHIKETDTFRHERQIHTSENASLIIGSKHESPSAMQIESDVRVLHSQKAQNEPKPHTPSSTQLPLKTPAPQRRTCAQNRKDESFRENKDSFETHETDSPKQYDFGSKSERITPSRRSQILSQFERYNVQTPSSWKTRSVESSSECFNIEPVKRGSTSEKFKSHTLTPRSKSKYEHLIKNLTESQDDNLVIYKVLETKASKPSPAPLPVTPYKEPKGKYTIEYLWNIGATNFHSRRSTRKCH